MVADMGMSVVPEEYKTADILHIIHCERNRIGAMQEYKSRMAQAPITPEGVRDLVFRLTQDKLQADKAYAKAILESTRLKQ